MRAQSVVIRSERWEMQIGESGVGERDAEGGRGEEDGFFGVGVDGGEVGC